MKILITLLIFLGIASGCSHVDPYEKSREIYQQTIAIHDQVMPHIGELMSIKFSLKSKLETVKDPALHMRMDSVIIDLGNTYDQMMEWMAGLQSVPGSATSGIEQSEPAQQQKISNPKEMLRIQEESLKKIKKLKTEMEKNIQRGKDILQKLP